MPYKVLLSKYFPDKVKCCKIVICWAVHTGEKVEITVDRNMVGGFVDLSLSVKQGSVWHLAADDILRQQWVISILWV